MVLSGRRASHERTKPDVDEKWTMKGSFQPQHNPKDAQLHQMTKDGSGPEQEQQDE